MSTYLLTWNPHVWPKEQFEIYYQKYTQGKILKWSCGTTKKILVGDNIFLLKQGKGNKGLIGSGVVTAAPYYAPHYQEEKRKEGKKSLYVDVKFDYLSNNQFKTPISRDELNTPEFISNIWDSQGSGKTIPANIADGLFDFWNSRIERNEQDFSGPDEAESSKLKEGGKKVITVNAYERNTKARRLCIEHWKYNCGVCNFHFEKTYGQLGKNYIHVHHLKPLSEINEEYDIDPVKDLRPVCPNCHAMLHRKQPALSIEELKEIYTIYNK